MHIDNPSLVDVPKFVGSFLVGKVAFGCTDKVEIQTCRTYSPTALQSTPNPKIMGDVVNEGKLDDTDSCWDHNLFSFTPIMQTYGLYCL